MPVSAEFVWTPPEGHPTAFVVELYETHVAEVRFAGSDTVVVHSPKWDVARASLVRRSGHGPAYLSDAETRESLYGTASAALRAALCAVPLPASAAWSTRTALA